MPGKSILSQLTSPYNRMYQTGGTVGPTKYAGVTQAQPQQPADDTTWGGDFTWGGGDFVSGGGALDWTQENFDEGAATGGSTRDPDGEWDWWTGGTDEFGNFSYGEAVHGEGYWDPESSDDPWGGTPWYEQGGPGIPGLDFENPGDFGIGAGDNILPPGWFDDFSIEDWADWITDDLWGDAPWNQPEIPTGFGGTSPLGALGMETTEGYQPGRFDANLVRRAPVVAPQIQNVNFDQASLEQDILKQLDSPSSQRGGQDEQSQIVDAVLNELRL